MRRVMCQRTTKPDVRQPCGSRIVLQSTSPTLQHNTTRRRLFTIMSAVCFDLGSLGTAGCA